MTSQLQVAQDYLDVLLDQAFATEVNEAACLKTIFKLDRLAEERIAFASRANTIGFLALHRGMYRDDMYRDNYGDECWEGEP